MGCLFGCVIELTVHDPRSSAHSLNVPGRNGDHIAHIVFVGQFTRQNIADDLHVSVTMGAKASAWLNSVLIDNAQIAPIHVIGIVITGK